jgi:hypothetical protein
MIQVSVVLQDFVDELVNILSETDINYDFWWELDEIDTESMTRLHNTVDLIFNDFFRIYKDFQRVTELVIRARETIKMALSVAMDVPFPVSNFHFPRVIDNIVLMFTENFRNDIYYAMIEANHSVHILQRSWRRSVSDPNFLACRRRLENEFNAAQREMVEWGKRA